MNLNFEQMLAEHQRNREPAQKVVIKPCPRCGWPIKEENSGSLLVNIFVVVVVLLIFIALVVIPQFTN
ncbi:hypothetical protein LCGC14_0573880 [marine sediment metagenome]|uniref:Uncharacterized protein n=1 Tax=marine sediment metagenome TaxID=412755 RepID=A0A0F9URJ2_9ZZZZ